MGMDASQARLLQITSRMHDTELEAQKLMNFKLKLSTQKDEVYQKYCDALDSKKIQVATPNFATGKTTYVDATFHSVCDYQEGRNVQYALRDTHTNRILVNRDVYDMYYGNDEYFGYSNDKYAFAWAMMGYDGEFCFDDYEKQDGYNVGTWVEDDFTGEKEFITMTQAEELVYENHKNDSSNGLAGLYDTLQNTIVGGTASDVNHALTDFRDKLYALYSNEILEYMNVDKSELYDPEDFSIDDYLEESSNPNFDKNEFDYYVQLFEEIRSNGGCEIIDAVAKDGDTGEDWFNDMVSSGRIIIDYYNKNNPEKGWEETSVTTSTQENYLQKVHDDSVDKIAEAEYEHELGLINEKDKRIDSELAKIETEHNALKEQAEAIKGVIKDNEERTYGIFG